MLTGRCLCGRIRYEITGKLGPVTYCHCESCRKAPDPERRPAARIFVGEKAPWFEITDDLPQSAGNGADLERRPV